MPSDIVNSFLGKNALVFKKKITKQLSCKGKYNSNKATYESKITHSLWEIL